MLLATDMLHLEPGVMVVGQVDRTSCNPARSLVRLLLEGCGHRMCRKGMAIRGVSQVKQNGAEESCEVPTQVPETLECVKASRIRTQVRGIAIVTSIAPSVQKGAT